MINSVIKKGSLLLMVMFVGIFLYGCSQGPVTNISSTLAAITVTPSSEALSVGDNQTFTASGTDSSGNFLSVTPVWTVTGGIGTISNSGVFTASTAGSGTVKATSGSIIGEAIINVTHAPHTITATCDANATYDFLYPDATFGTAPAGMQLGVGWIFGAITSNTGAYIKFDLSSIPSTATIDSATLKLFITEVSGSSGLIISYITSPWTESLVSYNNQPPLAVRITTHDFSTSDWSWSNIDITSAVTSWVSGAKPNYGMGLISSNWISTNYVNFYPRTSFSYPPKIEITYSY